MGLMRGVGGEFELCWVADGGEVVSCRAGSYFGEGWRAVSAALGDRAARPSAIPCGSVK